MHITIRRATTYRRDLDLRSGALILVITLGGSVMTGCESQTTAPATTTGLAIVVGAHAGAPRPALNTTSGRLVVEAIERGEDVSLVIDDGTPTATVVAVPPLDGSSEISRQVSVKRGVDAVKAAIAKAQPDSDGADPTEAILVAAAALPQSKKPRGTVLVLDSLFSDRGLFDTTEGIPEDPKPVADHIRAQARDVSLSGVHVVLSGGIGAGMDAQWPLTVAQAGRLADNYEAMLVALKATVDVDLTPRSDFIPVKTDFVVRPTPVPPIVSASFPKPGLSTLITLDERSVKFHPDSNSYVNPSGAEASLTSIAEWLKGSASTRTVSLTGTTSSAGDASGRSARSEGRASTVRTSLLKLGVLPKQVIKVEGVGFEFKGRIEDRDSDGLLVEGLARRNRLVLVTLTEAGP